MRSARRTEERTAAQRRLSQRDGTLSCSFASVIGGASLEMKSGSSTPVTAAQDVYLDPRCGTKAGCRFPQSPNGGEHRAPKVRPARTDLRQTCRPQKRRQLYTGSSVTLSFF